MSGWCGGTTFRRILYILWRERLLLLLLCLLQFSWPKVFQVTFPCLPPIWSLKCWDYRCVPLHPAVYVLKVSNSGCQACVANTDSQNCVTASLTHLSPGASLWNGQKRVGWRPDLHTQSQRRKIACSRPSCVTFEIQFQEVKGRMTRTIRIVILSPSSNCLRIKWENESYAMIPEYIYCKLS